MWKRATRPALHENRIDGGENRANIPGMIRPVFALVLAAALTSIAHAGKIQSAPADASTPPPMPKKLPNDLSQLASHSPTPNSGPARSPDEIVGTFFDTLKADHVDAAYDTLNAEFTMSDKSGQASSMREQTQKALDTYGPMLGYELVKEEKLGTHLLRRTYILTGESLPLRWKFYFYKASDRWNLIDLRIDDAIAEWFDDSSRK